MHTFKRFATGLALIATLLAATGCGTISTIGKLEDGAGAEASRMWDRWIEGDGDIAVATTWERKVKAGVSAKEVEEILKFVAVERNMRDVGTLPLSKELEARSGKKEKLLTVYSFCSPETARKMVDFSPAHVGLPAVSRDAGGARRRQPVDVHAQHGHDGQDGPQTAFAPEGRGHGGAQHHLGNDGARLQGPVLIRPTQPTTTPEETP